MEYLKKYFVSYFVRRSFLLIFLGISSIILGACSPIKTPTISQYTLTQVNTDTVHAPYKGKTVLITTPIAEPAYTTSKMAYVKKPYQIQYYAQNKWISAPAHLMAPLIVASLQHTNHFRQVVAAPYTGRSDYRIDTQLLTFEQDFMQNPSEFKLTVRFNIINNTTQTLVASKIFNTIATAPGDDAYSGVIAANRAMADMLGKMAQFVVKTI